MLKSTTTIAIDAPAERIYEIAHATEQWAQILPHYRFTRILSEDGTARTIEMAARRGILPIRWTALQRNDPRKPAIYFRHLTGWVKGMEVEWTFDERDGRTQVSIVHDVSFRFPFASRFIEKHVVAHFFIEGIAMRTLGCIKRLAEAVDG